MSKLIKKFRQPAGPIEYIGMPKEEFDWMNHMFWSDPNNPKYKWFLQYAKDKYGRQGDTKLPEVVIEGKRPEKTLAENTKENIEEVKLKWNNLPTDSKVDLALTGAGFIPGLDVVADVVDLGRSVKNGEWGNASLALLGLGLPVSGLILKSSLKNLKQIPAVMLINKHTKKYKPWLSLDVANKVMSEDLILLYNMNLMRTEGLLGNGRLISQRPEPIGEVIYPRTDIKKEKYFGNLDVFDKIWWQEDYPWFGGALHTNVVSVKPNFNHYEVPGHFDWVRVSDKLDLSNPELDAKILHSDFATGLLIPSSHVRTGKYKNVEVGKGNRPADLERMNVHARVSPTGKSLFVDNFFNNPRNNQFISEYDPNYKWSPITYEDISLRGDFMFNQNDVGNTVTTINGFSALPYSMIKATHEHPKYYVNKFVELKQGGRLIPKHAKGSPVNNNPLPKMPINTNPIPETKPKKRKELLIRPDFKNERPVPGLLTSPRIVGVNKIYGFK